VWQQFQKALRIPVEILAGIEHVTLCASGEVSKELKLLSSYIFLQGWDGLMNEPGEGLG